MAVYTSPMTSIDNSPSKPADQRHQENMPESLEVSGHPTLCSLKACIKRQLLATCYKWRPSSATMHMTRIARPGVPEPAPRTTAPRAALEAVAAGAGEVV